MRTKPESWYRTSCTNPKCDLIAELDERELMKCICGYPVVINNPKNDIEREYNSKVVVPDA